MMTPASASRCDDNFPDFARAVRDTLSRIRGPYFVAAVENLFGVYLSGFPAETRQTYNCHACRRFIEQYGALVTVDDGGVTRSVLWDEALVPYEYHEAVRRLRETVQRAPVDGVHLSSERVWGTPSTPDRKRGIEWSHFCVDNPTVHRHALLTASQVAAEKREDVGMLGRALGEFPIMVAHKALALVKTDTLYRSEKVLGVAEWFVKLHESLAGVHDQRRRRNLLWRAAAIAPPGYAHVRSTMIGTLLEDIASGMDLGAVAARFAEKMHPLQYQRPSAPPSDGAIAQAEKVVAELGAAGALERRFARLTDCVKLWTPRAAEAPKAEGVFAHLRPGARPEAAADVPGVTSITWKKFARTVLPTAEKIALATPPRGPYIALTTATNPDAPPILQWDRPERRNPVSWYVYNGGSTASQWGLSPIGWTTVTAIVPLPPTWGDKPLTHHGEGIIFTLEGAKDSAHTHGGGFFVEQLRSEFHGVRKVLEAYQMRAPITGKQDGDANGLDFRKGGRTPARVRVTAEGLRREYLIDRWD